MITLYAKSYMKMLTIILILLVRPRRFVTPTMRSFIDVDIVSGHSDLASSVLKHYYNIMCTPCPFFFFILNRRQDRLCLITPK